MCKSYFFSTQCLFVCFLIAVVVRKLEPRETNCVKNTAELKFQSKNSIYCERNRKLNNLRG